jgi:hypothetical protein
VAVPPRQAQQPRQVPPGSQPLPWQHLHQPPCCWAGLLHCGRPWWELAWPRAQTG